MNKEDLERLMKLAAEDAALDDPSAEPGEHLAFSRCEELGRGAEPRPDETRHLAACPTCARRLAAFGRALGSGPRAPSRSAPRHLRLVLTVAAAAAAALLLVVLRPWERRAEPIQVRVAVAQDRADVFQATRGLEDGASFFVGVRATRTAYVALVLVAEDRTMFPALLEDDHVAPTSRRLEVGEDLVVGAFEREQDGRVITELAILTAETPIVGEELQDLLGRTLSVEALEAELGCEVTVFPIDG